MPQNNPSITRLLRGLTALECLVLVISGGGLFFLPSVLIPLWPWEIPPFNARFMGAIYLGALASTIALAWVGHWSPARVVVPMILTFTTTVLVVSFAYQDRFTNAPSALAWFALYAVLALNAAYHVWLYRNLPPASGNPPSPFMRTLLWIQAVGIGAYGLALLLAPGTAGAFWPWVIDDFHARMYSSSFLASAVGAALLLRSTSRLEWFALGATQLAVGAASIIGLLIVDAAAQRVDWTLPGTWLWIALAATTALFGIFMLRASRAP